MEIQCFMLCAALSKVGAEAVYDAHMIGMHSFFSRDGTFPLQFDTPYFMLLRRDTRELEQQFSLRFDLVDQDGRCVGEPNNARHNGVLPAGHRFYVLSGMMRLVFPGIGDFRIDVTADEDGLLSVFPYAVEVTERPAGK
jgi:hypothetical protein